MSTHSWPHIKSVQDIDRIIDASHEKPQLIYKHSTRCNLSATVKLRLEQWDKTARLLPIHYLDLISYRSVSDYIEKHFKVLHESPQVLIISKGQSIYDEDHFRINGEDIEKALHTAMA